MTFVARFSFERPIPSRIYVHDCGLEIFDRDTEAAITRAGEYAKKHLYGVADFLKGKDYSLGIIWGDTNIQKCNLDLFGFSGIQDWHGNPDVFAWAFRNGIYVDAKTSSITCGDGF